MAVNPLSIMVLLGFLFLVASIFLSIGALIQIGTSRGNYTGIGIAVTVLILGILGFLVSGAGVLFLAGGADEPASSQSVVTPPLTVPRGTNVVQNLGVGRDLLPKERWPDKDDMPSGLKLGGVLNDDEAARKGDLPVGMAADVESLRYAAIEPGSLRILAFRYTSEFAQRRWERDARYRAWLRGWNLRIKGLRSRVFMRHGGDAEGSAAAEVLQKKLTQRPSGAAPPKKK